MENLYDFKERIEKIAEKIISIKEELNQLGAEETVDLLEKSVNTLQDFYIKTRDILQYDYDVGTKKECTTCKGRGHTLKEVTEADPNYPSGLPDSGWVTKTYDKKIPCKDCSGKGYLELKWV